MFQSEFIIFSPNLLFLHNFLSISLYVNQKIGNHLKLFPFPTYNQSLTFLNLAWEMALESTPFHISLTYLTYFLIIFHLAYYTSLLSVLAACSFFFQYVVCIAITWLLLFLILSQCGKFFPSTKGLELRFLCQEYARNLGMVLLLSLHSDFSLLALYSYI